jgi:DNA-directed RNA polymerase subunit RPC12/RpoP
MKAITCTQCGAIIKKISLRDKVAICDYCGVEILLEENKEKIIEIPDKKVALTYPESDTSDYQAGQDAFTVGKIFLGIAVFVFAIIIIFISGKSALDRRSNSKEKTLAATATPYAYATPFTFANVVSPKINYNVDVKWIGDDDMEHYEVPSIDETKLTTSDAKELKKTVFKNRSVQVKVTINEDGEVTEAKAISGHPILKEAAETAAKKTLFANRRKPAGRLLTYIFRLTSE